MQPQMMKNCSRCGNEATEDSLFCPRCGNSLKAAGADPLIGKVIADRYLLVEKIGEGRSGIIYRGEHTALRKKVAVKILHQQLSEDDAAMERFRREATTVGEIDNDHILQVLDFGRAADGRLFFAMELLDGEPLSKLLERETRLAVPRVIDILTQTGEALMEAHGLGYVHRDLRPRNIFLTKKRGKSDFVKLLDFGLSKLLAAETEAGSTVMGITFGDPRYIAPEQARGDTVDRRADLYSLGIVAYEMLTGEAPFVGARASDIIEQHLKSPPPSVRLKRGDCPVWLDAVIERALAKSPERRFITVLRMIECLKAAKAPSDDKLELASTEPFHKAILTPPHGHAAVDSKAAEVAVRDAAETIVPGAAMASAVASAPTMITTRKPTETNDVAPSETARLPQKSAPPSPNSPEQKGNGSAAPSPAPSSVASESSKKSKKSQKAERRAEEQKKREQGKSGEKKAIDNWWPPERKPADAPASDGERPIATLVDPVPAMAQGAASAVSARAVSDASATSGTSLPAAATVHPIFSDDQVTDKRPMAHDTDVTDRPPVHDTEVTVRPPLTAKVGSDSGSQRKVGSDSGSQRKVGSDSGGYRKVGGSTGEHEKWFDDSSQPAARMAADEFEEEPASKRNVGLIAGLSVGGAVALGLVLLAVIGRSSTKAPEGPKRSYDKPAVSAALEGKISDEATKKADEPAKLAAPVVPAAVIEAQKKVDEPTKVGAVDEAAKKIDEPKAPAPVAPPRSEEPKLAVAPPSRAPEKIAPPPEKPIAVVEKRPVERRVAEEKKPVDLPRAPDAKRDVKVAARPLPSGKNMPEGFRDPFSDKSGGASQADAFIKFGRQKLNSGDVAGAATQFNRAREFDNRNSEAIAGLGECAFEQGDYSGATVLLRQAVKLSPRRAHYVVLLGQAYYKLGKTKDAVVEYKRALKLDPRNEEAAHSLEVAERKLAGG